MLGVVLFVCGGREEEGEGRREGVGGRERRGKGGEGEIAEWKDEQIRL